MQYSCQKNVNGPKKVELVKTAKNKLDAGHVVILQNIHI